MFHGRDNDKLSDVFIDEDVVTKKLNQFRIGKSPGADDMSPRVLVELKDAIIFQINEIVKCSLDMLVLFLTTGK